MISSPPARTAPLTILLVRVSSLGDVLHNLPIVADILRHYPNAQIDWVVEEAYTSLVRLNDRVRTIIPIGLRRWRKSLGQSETRTEIAAFYRSLRAQQYDYVFDTQGLLKTGLIMGLTRLAPGGQKVGLADGGEDASYEGISRLFHHQSVRLPRRTHAVARGRLVVAHTLGYSVDSVADFGLPAAAPEGAQPDWMPSQPYAVYFHGTARQAKQWPAAHWVALGAYLAPLPILLPWGSSAELSAARSMAAQLPNAIVLPRLSMAQALLLARHAALVVGVDTGLTHIAAAFCRPTIELYCASPRWKTEGNWSPSIINLGDQAQPPSVAEVVLALKSLHAGKANGVCDQA